MKEPLKTFVAYAREDRVLKEQLVAGDAWNDTIHENIDAAGIFILLISDDFLRSDYCFNTEMQLALRGEAEDTAIVAPVILKECAWHTTGARRHPGAAVGRQADRVESMGRAGARH